MQRILTTADVIAAIPGLLGFVPADSLVVIGISDHERGLKIGITGRHDIAAADANFANYFANILNTHNTPRAAVIAITPDDETGGAAVRLMSDALTSYGIETDHRAVVTRCDQPAPYRDLITGDTGISGDYRDSFASTRRVMDGQPIQEQRSDLRASIAATTEPALDTTGVELQPDVAAKAVVSAMVNWPTEIPRELSAQVAAMIGRHLVYRDAFVRTAAYDPAAAAAVFTELARPLRDTDRANVLTLAAACYYFAGNGSVVNVILDHIAEDTELPSFARLLDQSIRAGISPDELRTIIPTAELADELFRGHFPTPEDFA
ncbi:DUF4192 domain-containing protein (plasmid) [Gordonia amicalis]|uniref:DUF4192 domain-containing protein n=1 Tax=Gordonia terrae TaxID=2055 RepID=A0A2I1R2F0_9ACTN|nr:MULTISPECIES: DUF4192 domain-containing protein [Gordonia]MDH3026230.1 DUF4192 domain-containing protein [Gordonia alkanivorans]PKZ63289.1 hypothetical protein CYJ73_22430 [Gordonia terrae]UOG23653.1 DUF4192 domain-containing protein [Gordonia amicalis]UPW07021.1 DUF4192 domain-containing protein [Gordonia terrae]UPW16393.1 DUF4192 domain-containing protein [Gordonia amicalis]